MDEYRGQFESLSAFRFIVDKYDNIRNIFFNNNIEVRGKLSQTKNCRSGNRNRQCDKIIDIYCVKPFLIGDIRMKNRNPTLFVDKHIDRSLGVGAFPPLSF